MKSVLITGSRNIVALDFLNALVAGGCRVYLADTWMFPMLRQHPGVCRYFKCPSPRFHFAQYHKKLESIVHEYQIDMIIPMCEEAFYLSALKEQLNPHCEVFTSSFALMKQLHSKLHIMSLAQDCGIQLPITTQIISQEDIKQHPYDDDIIKPEYSRFGHRVVSVQAARKRPQKTLTETAHVLQQRIQGQEYCTYALCREGKVLIQTVYLPVFRLHLSASVYFKRVMHPAIEQFVQNFVKKHRYTGQISFDIIESDDGIYLIECNPRASSGIHLLSHIDFASLLFDSKALQNPELQPQLNHKYAMLGYAMVLVILPQMLRRKKAKQWCAAMWRARNILQTGGYQLFSLAGALTLGEMLYTMLKTRHTFRAAATYDIEYNGQDI